MRILVLSTWLPYPPINGGKTRAYHLIKALAKRHEVGLCSFADAPLEAAWLHHLGQFCCRVEVVPRNPFLPSRVRTALGWLSLRPSAVCAAYSRAMAQRVRALAAEWKPERVVALTWVTVPYALQVADAVRIADVDFPLSPLLHDAYRRSGSIPERARRWLAWQKFRRYERYVLARCERCLVVSEQERHELLALLGGRQARISVVPNGVDVVFNRPGLAPPQPNTLIFSGALTYDANYDAMDYFLREIFPLVHAALPDVQLRITGATKGVAVPRLPLDGRTTLTGFIDDVRTVVAASCVCVVPLRIGGGTRVKILEAMALGTPVVSTPKGAEGLDVVAGEHVLIGDTPADFAAHTIRLLNDPALRQRLARNARRLVVERYGWGDIGRHFRHVVEGAAPAAERPAEGERISDRSEVDE